MQLGCDKLLSTIAQQVASCLLPLLHIGRSRATNIDGPLLLDFCPAPANIRNTGWALLCRCHKALWLPPPLFLNSLHLQK